MSLIGFLAVLIGVPSTGSASDTNVFVVKDSLRLGELTDKGVQLLKSKKKSDPLLGTNSSAKLAIAVLNTDCRFGGLDPKIWLVAYNSSTKKIVAPMVDFTTLAPIFVGDGQIIMQAVGEGRKGVEAASLNALIYLSFDPCQMLGDPTNPRSVEIDPIGYIRPTGAIGNGPIQPDGGTLAITSDDPNNPDLLIPLSGKGTIPSPNCRIDVEPLALDFGTVNFGDTNTHTFTIHNNGLSACTVSNITRNGSTAFTNNAPLTSFVIAPGDSVVITARFTPILIGADSAVMRVTSSDPDEPQQFVNLTGNGVVLPAPCLLDVAPLFLDFGGVEVGSNKTLNVTLANSGGSTCTVDAITLVTNNVLGFSFSPAASLAVPPGTSVVIAVTFTPLTVTNATGTLEIDSLSPTNLALVTLLASGVAAECHLGVDPTALDFGAVGEGGSRTQRVVLSNIGVTDCTIDGLDITNTAFSFVSPATTPFVLSVGTSTNIDVEFTPVGNGTTNGVLSVTNSSPLLVTNITLTGLGVVPITNCNFVASPASLAFGSVAVGETNVLKTKVSNVGLSNCVINSITFIGSNDFTLVAPTNSPFTVAPNGFIEVGVRYTPSDIGSDTGTVQIVSEDEFNTIISVPVSGNGGQPLLSINTSSLAFGGLPVGSNSTLSAFVTNIGTVPATIHSITILGSGDFSLGALVPNSQFVLNPGITVEIPVRYQPSGLGDDSGTLTVDSNDPNSPLQASLSGSGLLCQLSVTPSPINFGTVALGHTNRVTLSIHNSGNINCTVELMDVLGSGRFELGGPTAPFIVGAGATVDVDVEYLPLNIDTIMILSGRLKGSGKPTTVSP